VRHTAIALFDARVFAALLMRRLGALACLLMLWAAPVSAQFAVAPIRLDLGASARSGAIAVRNESQEAITFQMQAMEWTQDAEGKDKYEDSKDLIYFPKIMTVEPGQEGLVRVGLKNALLPHEKAYRVFIEQLPPAQTPEARSGPRGSAQVNVLIRFGAPVFVSPVQPQDSAQFTAMGLAKGVLTLGVKNTGNRHQVVQGIEITGVDAQGQQVYALTLADRYLLAGTGKAYTATIPAAQCTRITGLFVELKTDKLGLKNKLDVSRGMCS
jgi:fimbrial chaperone protein